MASLSDQIDRLARNTRSIKSTAELIVGDNGSKASIGPYTRAVLSAELGDLIRDIDSSELALFTLQKPAQAERIAPPPELARATFTGATPLRQPTIKREDSSKPGGVEPEVYAHAALKCIDRYQTIRPMPRAKSRILDIIARLKAARAEITGLNSSLEKAPALDASTQRLVDEEEQGIRDLQQKLLELRQRKQQAIKDNEKEGRMTSKGKNKPQIRAPPPPSPQDAFWNTPMASAKTLRFTDNLMNEQVNLEDVSMTSFSEVSPLTERFSGPSGSTLADIPASLTPLAKPAFGKVSQGDDKLHKDSVPPVDHKSQLSEMLVTPKAPSPVPQSKPSGLQSGASENRDDALEPYIEKFWSTMGDSIFAGHVISKDKKQRIKDTLLGLRSVSNSTPTPSSPSASTLSSATSADTTPTPQQILTAYLLLTLLTSPPEFAISMNKAKELLSVKGADWGSTVVAGQGTSRIIYSCVAKRLLKIDRGGGEQKVRFDV